MLLSVLVILEMGLRSLENISSSGLIVDSSLLSSLLQSFGVLVIPFLLFLEGLWFRRSFFFSSHFGLCSRYFCGHNNPIIK